MYNNVGKREFRVDAESKVTGKAIYPQDIYMDGMLYGKTFRSSVPHAYITLDVSKAEAMDGVVKIFTAKDVTGENHHGVAFKDHEVFCEKKVRRIGDPMAFVVAETQKIAEEALNQIVVEYEEIEGVFDPKKAMEENSPQVHDGQSNAVYHYKIRKGDIDEAFAKSDIVVEEEYETGMVDHAFLQPEAGVAYMEDDKVVVCVSTQYPHFDRIEVAEALGVPEEQIRILNPAVGGAFGGREDITLQIHLALATRALKKPIKSIYDREESFYAHSKRHAFIMKYKMGATKDGKLTAAEIEIVGDTGAYASWVNNVLRKGGVHATGPYEIPNVKVDSYGVYTNNPFAGAMRGFGATQMPVAYEQHMDIMAEKLGMDPVEFRMKNIFKKGSVTATGQELYESVPAKECLEAVASRIKKDGSTKKRGIGYGCSFYGTGYGNGFPDVSVAEAELNSDGKINVYVGATECGQGSDTIMRQIAAEPFKIGIDSINYYSTDTDMMKDSGTAAASRQTYNTGNAIRLASEKLKDKLIEKAKNILNLNTTVGLEVADGEVFLSSFKSTKISFSEMAVALGDEKLREEATFIAHSTEMDEETGQGCPYWPYTFGAAAVEVEVDTETGKVEITRAASAQDVGRAINPELVEGQMDGGFAMAYGYAMLEDLGLKNGKIVNNRFTSYLIPTAMDMPELEKIIIEDPESTGPYGAKGIGEPVMTYVTPAILNAIYDATGVRMTEIPVTPEKLLKAIKEQGRK